MRWCWLAIMGACGTDPVDVDPFPGGTVVVSSSQQIFEIVGDGTTVMWLTMAASQPAGLWELRTGETVPTKLYSFSPGNPQPGALVLVNHRPYFETWVGEGASHIVTLDDTNALVELGDGTLQLSGGEGSFLVRSRNDDITIADPRTGPDRDPWEMTLHSDFGTYVYGAGKVVHSLYADGEGGSGETIELGTGKREVFAYPRHRPLALIPATDGFFFYESGLGLFHAASAGTSQLTADLGFGSFVAFGDDVWFATTTGGELQPTVTGLARIRPDGSASVRQLQAAGAMLFRNGSELMAITIQSTYESTLWHVDPDN